MYERSMQNPSEGINNILSAIGAPKSKIKFVPTDKVIKTYKIPKEITLLSLNKNSEIKTNEIKTVIATTNSKELTFK